MNIVITGCGGLQGSHLCEALIAAGHTVVGYDNYSRGTYRAEFIHNQDLSIFCPSLKGTDVVYHLAAQVWGVAVAQTHNWEMLRHNMQVDMNVLHAAAEAGVRRVIYPSTACIYPVEAQEHWDSILKEDATWGGTQGQYGAEPNPESGYGWAKLMGEVLVGHYPLEHVIFRFFNVYGDGENAGAGSHVIPELIRKVLAAPPGGEMEVYGTGEQGRTFLHVDDAVRAYIAAMECPSGSVMNCGDPSPVRISDLAEMICALDGRGVRPIYNQERPTGVFGRTPDITRARSILGWEPQIHLSEGLKRVYQSYAKEKSWSVSH